MADTSPASQLWFMLGPSGVGSDAVHELQRKLGFQGTGRFANSVTERAPRSMVDMFVFPDSGSAPQSKDNVIAKRAFSRALRGGLPPEGAHAESENPASQWAQGEQSPVGAVMEAMFPNAYDLVLGAAEGSWPGATDVAAAFSDVAPGPAELKAGFNALGPAKNLVAPIAKGLANAGPALAANPHVVAASTAAKASAPIAAGGFALTRYIFPEMARAAEEMAERRAIRAHSPLRAADDIDDFDPLDPNWVHPRFRSQRGSAALLDDGAVPGAVEPTAERSQMGLVKGIQGTVAGEPLDFEGRQRVAYPGIYGNPRDIIEDLNVAPESEWLSRLFGTTRQELGETALTRPGNLDDWRPPGMPAAGRGSAHARAITTPENAERIGNVMAEARNRPDLYSGAVGWYEMDPLYQRMVELMGPEEARRRFLQQQSLMGLASPGSDVLTEINRGSRADFLAEQGRFADFARYGGNPQASPLALMPEFAGARGHPFHSTAQAPPMRQFLESGGEYLGKQPKVPAYVVAGRTPELGYQTNFPVPDAHWSRGAGLSDVRGAAGWGKSGTHSEMSTLAPWWRDISAQQGLEAVPGQALTWNAFARQTGVDSPVGAPKLELIANSIAESAAARGKSPEEARDLFLRGLFPIGELAK